MDMQLWVKIFSVMPPAGRWSIIFLNRDPRLSQVQHEGTKHATSITNQVTATGLTADSNTNAIDVGLFIIYLKSSKLYKVAHPTRGVLRLKEYHVYRIYLQKVPRNKEKHPSYTCLGREGSRDLAPRAKTNP